MSGIHQEILHINGRLSFHLERIRRFEGYAAIDKYDLVELDEHHQCVSELRDTLETLIKLEKEQHYARQSHDDS